MLKVVLFLLGAAALIGVGVGIGVLIFTDEEEETALTSLRDRLNTLRQEMDKDVDAILIRIGRNEEISTLREALLRRCLEDQERLREDREATGAAEKLGDICDEIRDAPDNAVERWKEIRQRLDEVRP